MVHDPALRPTEFARDVGEVRGAIAVLGHVPVSGPAGQPASERGRRLGSSPSRRGNCPHAATVVRFLCGPSAALCELNTGVSLCTLVFKTGRLSADIPRLGMRVPVKATERRIHSAALRLFAARGSKDVTMSELAEEADVARGTLYRNVQSIDQLFEQARAQLVFDLHDSNARAMDDHRDLDPPLRLATAIRMIVRRAHEDPAMGRFLVQFGLTDESLRQALVGPPMADIEAGIRAGRYSVVPEMALSLVSLLIGAVVSAMWMVLEGRQTWREAGTGTGELILCALGIPRGEAVQLASAPLPALPEL